MLVVEDNPADAGLIRKALEEHGVEGEMTHIIDGETAIAFIEAVDTDQLDCPDLAIIDLNLPRRPGQDVLERMRQSPKCREIPVVILSSSDAKRDWRMPNGCGPASISASRRGWRNFLVSGPSSRLRWTVLPNRDQDRLPPRRRISPQLRETARTIGFPILPGLRRASGDACAIIQTRSEPRKPLAHSKIPRRCDTRKQRRSGDHKRGRRRVV